MMLTNRGEVRDTWEAWEYYRGVRARFGRWVRVELAFAHDPQVKRYTAPSEPKVVRFTDDQGSTLDLHGVNFGYEGGTPGELVETLVQEGFSKTEIATAVFNTSGEVQYPQIIEQLDRCP